MHSINDRVASLFPHANPAHIEEMVAKGRAYAAKWDKLPASYAEAVAQLFVCYGLSPDAEHKAMYRTGIDSLMRPYYKGVDRART